MSDDDYVVGHLQEALAHSGETDVQVRLTAERLVITGNVATEQRRDAITTIARDVVGDIEIRNEVTVVRQREPDGEEQLS